MEQTGLRRTLCAACSLPPVAEVVEAPPAPNRPPFHAHLGELPDLHLPEVPKVEVYLIDRPDEQPLGSGEASTRPAAAAIANAVSNAVGRRVRNLPLNPGWIKGVTE